MSGGPTPPRPSIWEFRANRLGNIFCHTGWRKIEYKDGAFWCMRCDRKLYDQPDPNEAILDLILYQRCTEYIWAKMLQDQREVGHQPD